MKLPYQNFTISRVTMREIGTKLLKRESCGHLYLEKDLREDENPSASGLDEKQAPAGVPSVVFVKVQVGRIF